MSDKKKQLTIDTGVGLLGWTFLIFLGLKLGEVGAVASWSWWWVFAPLWGPVALGGIAALLVIGIGITVGLVAAVVDEINKKKT